MVVGDDVGIGAFGGDEAARRSGFAAVRGDCARVPVAAGEQSDGKPVLGFLEVPTLLGKRPNFFWDPTCILERVPHIFPKTCKFHASMRLVAQVQLGRGSV
eukprot:SAG11_NODE_1256_length_5374_cov_5.627627_2_plen_101_part_00